MGRWDGRLWRREVRMGTGVAVVCCESCRLPGGWRCARNGLGDVIVREP